MASYPTAIWGPTTKNFNDTIQPAHINDAQAEIVAMETDLVNGMSRALNLGTIGQVVFPATQNPSAGANTLDDYEEGTWTPAFGGSIGTSGQVYSNQEGRYIKVGSLVWAAGFVRVTTLGTVTGNFQINGLPFQAETGALQYYMGVVEWDALSTAVINIKAYVPQNVSYIALTYTTAANTTSLGASFAQSDLSNTSAFRVMVVYKAAA